MSLKDTPIQRRLTAIILLVSGTVLLLTCAAFFAYEFVSFRHTTAQNLSTLGAAISSNSTAALAFENQDDAGEILSALKAEPHVVAAGLYDRNGTLFSKYPPDLADSAFPKRPEGDGIRFGSAELLAFQPVVQGRNRLGTLYLKFDTQGLYQTFELYGAIVILVMSISSVVAYLLSRTLQKQISQPILELAETARAISERRDYSVRATGAQRRDELGLLTDAFNQMLTQIHEQDQIRSRFVAIIESSDDAIISKTFDGTITSWNRGAEKIFGYSAHEVIGKPMLMIFPPDRYDEESEILARVRRGESLQQFETVRVRKDGSLVEIAATISPIKDAHGEVLGASITAREITELRRAEAEIQKLNQELEQRVIHRTAQLEAANKQLREAKEIAEAATLAKGRFLATMSHEIRTPINGVIGMTGLLLQTRLTAEQRDYAETIGQSGESLLKVINDILDFSKVEAGKLELESVSFSLRECVGGLLKSFATRLDRKGLELIADIPAGVPDRLVGDPMRLRQILSNLVDNALKFTASGEVVVRATSELVSDGMCELHFSVADTGIGIPADKQPVIFEPFAQVDNTTTRTYGGTGLGLAIAAQLIQQMHGRIWLNSKVGVGSTFHFVVQLAAESPRQPVAPRRELRDREGVNVLVVDDNATNRRVLCEMLRGWRMSAVAVDSGAEALKEIERAATENRHYEVAIIDAAMPELDGLDLAQRIRNRPEFATAIVLMVSSGLRAGAAARCQELGVASVLTKPVGQSELLDAIATAGSADAIETAQPIRDAPSVQTASDLRVLLVEDNAVNRKVALAQLRALGCDATVAHDGVEALQALDQSDFDVVLMDCHMPRMDGYEAAAAIRQRDGSKQHTWIIAMTADAMAGDREQCLAAGMDDYVSKPVRSADLAAVLARAQPNNAEAPIDPRALEQLRGLPDENGERTFQSLLRMFAADAPRILGEMYSALDRADGLVLAAAAHSLKGSSSLFGAHRVQERCAEIEKAAKAGDFKTVAGSVSRLQRQLQLVLAALEEESRRDALGPDS